MATVRPPPAKSVGFPARGDSTSGGFVSRVILFVKRNVRRAWARWTQGW